MYKVICTTDETGIKNNTEHARYCCCEADETEHIHGLDIHGASYRSLGRAPVQGQNVRIMSSDVNPMLKIYVKF